MKNLSLLIVCFFIWNNLFAQGSLPGGAPYKTTWVEGVVTAGALGLGYWGLRLMKDKEGVSREEILRIDADLAAAKKDIPSFDRWAAGNFNEQAERISDIPFYASFGLPLLFLADARTRSDAPQIGLLYLETMAITGALFAQVNGRVERMRPSVYSQSAGEEVRMDDKSRNSFYGGHVTATAAATFFAAKVFNDYFPNSSAKPYIWAGAAALPAAVGYLRLKAGKHFLSDNLIGYVIGAGVGVLVPHLHKKSSKLSLFPGQTLSGSSTVHLSYRF